MYAIIRCQLENQPLERYIKMLSASKSGQLFSLLKAFTSASGFEGRGVLQLMQANIRALLFCKVETVNYHYQYHYVLILIIHYFHCDKTNDLTVCLITPLLYRGIILQRVCKTIQNGKVNNSLACMIGLFIYNFRNIWFHFNYFF